MVLNTCTFFETQRSQLSCVWMETGDAKRPLACIWTDADLRTPEAHMEEQEEPEPTAFLQILYTPFALGYVADSLLLAVTVV